MNLQDPELNKAILDVLQKVQAGLKAEILRDEVAIKLRRPSLTTQDFDNAIRFLEARDLIARDLNLLGRPIFTITPRGEEALRGA